MEALERANIMMTAAILFILLWFQGKGVVAQRNNTRMSYVCPPQFIRLGHSCYYFSDKKETWQNALFACKDLESDLTVPARWEDRNLRNHLNEHSVAKESRWIGGIYDYATRAWKWGGELRRMHYQSFSKMKKMSPEELQFHCIAMEPELLYRWAPRKCFEPRRYICQTKLHKVPKEKVKDLSRRWLHRGKINEITVPSASREVNDPMVNDVTPNPVHHPKSYDLHPNQLRPNSKRHGPRRNPIRSNPKAYDLRPNELKKRSRPIQRRLIRPFPGYAWNRRDPEGSYQRNAELLRSGRTGLSPQKVKFNLARLARLRDRQIAKLKRLREKDEWLVNEPKQALAHAHPRTYTLDNNISALHPKTIVEEFDMMPTAAPVSLPTTVPQPPAKVLLSYS